MVPLTQKHGKEAITLVLELPGLNFGLITDYRDWIVFFSFRPSSS
jgi:hypothetical protein